MKIKSIFAVAIITLITTGGLFAQNTKNSKTLVMYFSWSGTTEKMAKMISSSTGGELFKIEPTEAYPTSYKDCADIVKKELDGGKIRTVKAAPDFSKYDTVFVGVPVWWHTAPTLMTHFLEEHAADLKGKTVIPFCTYQATYRAETLQAIVDATPTASHKESYGTTNPKQADIDAWLKKIGVAK
ncbi:flavodoxin [uncultured Treponema sp.]|uniref:flavodoxin n=1 Tax=uncultured Treponema sp. TaxID=162155 RepID=UPI0025F0944C|nr:flavodoxin [uncultured Treponema sp.]